MHSLDELAMQPWFADELWNEERHIVDVLREHFGRRYPPHLKNVGATWEEPYLTLELVHDDGTRVTVLNGDGYTSVTAGDVAYHGYLEPDHLAAVVIGMFDGRTTHVRVTRRGHEVEEHFEVRGRGSLGYAHSLGLTSLLLRLVPGARDVRRQTAIRFDATPSTAPILSR